MERQSEIRQALNSFLPTPSRLDATPGAAKAAGSDGPTPGTRTTQPFIVSEAQRAILSDLQYSLRKHGIDAGVDEIGKGILEALAARPSLCRGLLAAYLLDL